MIAEIIYVFETHLLTDDKKKLGPKRLRKRGARYLNVVKQIELG